MTSTTPISENKDDRSADVPVLAHGTTELPRDILEELVTWLEAALTCRNWNWDPQQREAAEFALNSGKDALSKAPSGAGPTYAELEEERDALIKELDELRAADRDHAAARAGFEKRLTDRAETAEKERDEARKALREAKKAAESCPNVPIDTEATSYLAEALFRVVTITEVALPQEQDGKTR